MAVEPHSPLYANSRPEKGAHQWRDWISHSLIASRRTAYGISDVSRLRDPVFKYYIEIAEARSWLFSVYAWISFEGGGTIVRIGKSEGELIGRISQYKNSLNTCASDMLSGRLGPNKYYAGDTKPWELEGWRDYTVPFSGGLIFAKQVTPQHTALPAKKALENEELRLIRDHNPPLNGTSRSGRLRCKEWAAIHGPTIAVSKLTGLPIERKSKGNKGPSM